MPRKQNGWGNTKSLGFKSFGRTDVGKIKGAAGSYPSDRQYGSTVKRSVIEKYDMDSDWVKWRKGYEYSVKAAWYKLESYNNMTQEYEIAQIYSKLYQGTANEVETVFDGFKFATTGSDSNNHYVVRRTTLTDPKLGKITSVLNDPLKYAEQLKNREIWCKGQADTGSRLLGRMINDRITDGETEATLKNILTTEGLPVLYTGKTPDRNTTVTVNIPFTDLEIDQGGDTPYAELVGKICYIQAFYVEKPIGEVETVFVDDDYTFTVDVKDKVTGVEVKILDPELDDLPPSLYDISTLPVLYYTSNGSFDLKAQYLFDKSKYQRFYGKQYMTADLVEKQIELVSYTVMPFTILGIKESPDGLTFNSVPFDSEFRMTADPGPGPTLVFADWSFTKASLDDRDGKLQINSDVDPWMDEVFTSGNPMKIATIYACSCPNHSQAQLRVPQEYEDEGTRKNNRQRRAPLPSAMSPKDYDELSSNKASSIFTSWESQEHKLSYKLCKHSIAAMFIDDIKLLEPSKLPSIDARLAFEEKLDKEMNAVGQKFVRSYKRGGITALEVVFALAQGLNLDDVELAYVMLNSNF